MEGRLQDILAESEGLARSDRLEEPEKITQLLKLSSEIHRGISLKNSNFLIERLLDGYRKIQILVAESYLAISKPIQAIQALDRAIIVIGQDGAVLNRIKSIEAQYRQEIDRENLQACSLFTSTTHSKMESSKATCYNNITEVEELSLETFFRAKLSPFILRSFALEWPAINNWKHPGYFTSRFGHRLVPVEIGSSYLQSDWKQELMSLASLFTAFEQQSSSAGGHEILYMAQHDLVAQIPELETDIATPGIVEALGDKVYRNLWIGMVGSHSPLHHDPYNNFFVQIVGRKRFLLIDPKYSPSLNMDDSVSGHDNNSDSTVDNNVPFISVVLDPGDMLFIPFGWWHSVRGLSNGISISFWC